MKNKLNLPDSILNLLECKKITNNQDKKLLNKLLLLQKNNNWFLEKDLALNFIIITVLVKHLPEKITGTDLAKILKILTKYESQVGGPYLNKDGKIDLTTNIAIAYFLSLNEVTLPNLENLIKQALNQPIDPLASYLLSQFYKETPKVSAITSDDDNVILFKIVEAAKQRFKNLDDGLKNIALEEIQRTIKKNKDKQMSLISYYFKIALGKKGAAIDENFIIQAGLANIFYWTAFIIYDDFWDEDEKAIPKILPAANLYARHYTDFYNHALLDNLEFRAFFHALMDKLDAANTWETIYCRAKVAHSKFIIPKQLPDYKNYDFKFYPASGQILGPLVILIKAGFNLDSKEAKNLISYFKNYLIAMQINDDSHDWLEDIKRGHLSTVVTLLVKDWEAKYPNQKEIDLAKDLEKLQKLFWFKTIKTASELAILYTSKSKEALANLSFLENPAPLEHYINITENIAKLALNEQQKSLDFLKEFN